MALLLVVGCSPGSVKPTVKIGLSAPFEGRYRDLGYEMLHAVRLAVSERNESGGVGGRYLVEFVALNDFSEVEAAAVQARKMAVDRDVLGVLGGWLPETAETAVSLYGGLGLAILVPDYDLSVAQPPLQLDAGFEADYAAVSGGVPPGPAALWAYEGANQLLDALDAATRAEGRPTRQGVLQALSTHP